MKSLIHILSRVLLVVALAIFVGCSDDDDDNGSVRVLHASPTAPAVDVLIDGAVAISSLSYGNITGYAEVEEGIRNFVVAPAGTTTAVINASPEIMGGVFYTVVAFNNLDSISVLVLVNDLEPPSGSGLVRVGHVAPSAPSVDVYITVPGGSIIDIDPTLEGVEFSSVSEYLTVPPGAYQAFITIAGTKTIVIDSGQFTVEAGGSYSAFALDAAGGGSSFSILVTREN